jgi:hypothetical protein
VAQLGARFHGMEEVVGSIPTRSTIFSITYRQADRTSGDKFPLLGKLETAASISLTERFAINKCPEPARTRRVAQFAQRLDFNLADAFARNLKILSHFFKSMF